MKGERRLSSREEHPHLRKKRSILPPNFWVLSTLKAETTSYGITKGYLNLSYATRAASEVTVPIVKLSVKVTQHKNAIRQKETISLASLNNNLKSVKRTRRFFHLLIRLRALALSSCMPQVKILTVSFNLVTLKIKSKLATHTLRNNQTLSACNIILLR